MDTESYGSQCPCCSNPVLVKQNTGSTTLLRYDACPWCGFIHYEHSDSPDVPSQGQRLHMWNQIMEHHSAPNMDQLRLQYVVMRLDQEIALTFDYRALDPTELAAMCVLPQEPGGAVVQPSSPMTVLADANHREIVKVLAELLQTANDLATKATMTGSPNRATGAATNLLSALGEAAQAVTALTPLDTKSPITIETDKECPECGSPDTDHDGDERTTLEMECLDCGHRWELNRIIIPNIK
ncbi:zinc ribbon domain-containing protein [Ferrimonas marina]|uniref:Uncharacterized protein n=1 Tax=Ferrimonas marina TaxID=299255 RepID=A0A1M5TL07_9GAMM|nr:hypothetical protein [Ferrimonas marina]SHH51505.1 hypothetical protein SAMN02745129_2190 [Ferrimonas marina]